MIWNWIRFLLVIIWAYLLVTPLGKLPAIGTFFVYTKSALHQHQRFNYNQTFGESPYGELQINYDTLGIPYIFANNDMAAAYGLGFSHAKDRLFQLEMIRRVVTGTLAEVAGEAALPSDLFWRKFQFKEQVKNQMLLLEERDSATYQLLEAYTEGINDFSKTFGYGSLPLEFSLLTLQEQNFGPEISFYLIAYMNHMLSYTKDGLEWSKLYAQVDSTTIKTFYPEINPLSVPIYPELDPKIDYTFVQDEPVLLSDNKKVFYKDDDVLGSNNWVIAPKKTGDGSMLCNDPHLAIGLPSTWYEVHFVVDGKMRHGFSIAGAPFVISGFSDSLAWGITNATWGLARYYQLDADANGTYLLDGEQVKPTSVEEEIKIKGAKTKKVTFYTSYFGPIDTIGGKIISTQWVVEKIGEEVDVFVKLNNANNVDEGLKAIEHLGGPAQNFVLADASGNIAGVTAGYAIMNFNKTRGITKGNKKVQKMPFVKMQPYLQIKNPEKNYIFTANQEQVLGNLTGVLSSSYAASQRARRIRDLIEVQTQITPEIAQEIQTDVVDLDWQMLHDRILETAPEDVLPLFNQFEGSCDTGSVAAAWFYAFKRNLHMIVCRNIHPQLEKRPKNELVYLLVNQQEKLKINGKDYNSIELCKEAWDSTRKELGALTDRPLELTFGEYHKIPLTHLARIPQLSLADLPTPGSNATVNVSPGFGNHGASMRTVIHFAKGGPEAWFVLAGGQSGRYFSPNYANQFNQWANSGYRKVVLKHEANSNTWVLTYKFNNQ